MATGKHELLSCYGDFHGKSGHAVSLARMTAPMVLRAHRILHDAASESIPSVIQKPDGTIDTDAYLDFYDEFIKEATTNQIAAIVLEPIQGGLDQSFRLMISSLNCAAGAMSARFCCLPMKF